MLSVPTGPVTEAKMVPRGTSVVTADQSKLVLITHALWLLHTKKPLILACIAILYDKIITIQLEQAMVWYRIKCLRKVKEMASAGVPIFSDSVHLRKMAKKEVCCAGSLCGEAVLALWSDTVALHMFNSFILYIYKSHFKMSKFCSHRKDRTGPKLPHQFASLYPLLYISHPKQHWFLFISCNSRLGQSSTDQTDVWNPATDTS